VSVFAEPLAQAREALNSGQWGDVRGALAALDLIQREAELLIEDAKRLERKAGEMEKALDIALDCKGSYNGTVSERGGEPALCTKCEKAVRAALSASGTRNRVAREEAR
jgi:hypothetical protein